MTNYTKVIKSRVSYEQLFINCIISGRDYYDGEIVNGRIIISDGPSNPRYYARAIRLDLIDVIETPTDLSEYGFCKVNNSNRWIRRRG
jgi:hypothetical protein